MKTRTPEWGWELTLEEDLTNMSDDYLEKYKPTIDLSKSFVFDETLPDSDLAFDLNKKLVVARKLENITFIAMGHMLKVIRDRKLYKNLDYEDFSQYCNSDDLDFSREKAYACIRIYELFIEKLGLNPDEISKLGIARLHMLAPTIKKIEDRDEAIAKVEEARDLRYNDFVRQNKTQANIDGKPNFYWSEEQQKWIVNFYDDMTELKSLGNWGDRNG